MESLSVAGRRIGPDAPPYVIAEIGANHNGDLSLCRELIDAAKACGADAVKFQSWTKQSLISQAEYRRNTRYIGDGVPTLEQAVEQYQLTPDAHREVAAYCRQQGVVFFSSCFSRQEVELLASLDAPAYKVASMDVNHIPLLEVIARTGKPVMLSAGMATVGEVERALGALRAAGATEIAVLHCVSVYPCPPALVNLRMISTWRQVFGVPVGYSDHTLGAAVPIAAVATGACIIEKHFTLDHALPGWDHGISADPTEFRQMVDGARAAWEAAGDGVRRIVPEEIDKRKVFRRRMVAVRELKRGERLGPADVEFKRPGTGIQPDELPYVVGRALTRDVGAEEELEWRDLA
jgi:N,N'-diacetyllegionaminate synthase